MAGNSNSGNRTGKRGKPLPMRVRLTESNARRLLTHAQAKADMEMMVNLIIREWLDLHWPEPPQS